MGKYATCPGCGHDDAWIRAGERVCNHCESAQVIVRALKLRPTSVAWAAAEVKLELELEAEWQRRREAGELRGSGWAGALCDECGGDADGSVRPTTVDGALRLLCPEHTP